MGVVWLGQFWPDFFRVFVFSCTEGSRSGNPVRTASIILLVGPITWHCRQLHRGLICLRRFDHGPFWCRTSAQSLSRSRKLQLFRLTIDHVELVTTPRHPVARPGYRTRLSRSTGLSAVPTWAWIATRLPARRRALQRSRHLRGRGRRGRWVRGRRSTTDRGRWRRSWRRRRQGWPVRAVWSSGWPEARCTHTSCTRCRPLCSPSAPSSAQTSWYICLFTQLTLSAADAPVSFFDSSTLCACARSSHSSIGLQQNSITQCTRSVCLKSG